VVTLALPKRALPVVMLAVVSLFPALYLVSSNAEASIMLAVLAFFLSGFLADALTGIAHFSFDYVFPHSMPIVGPIAREFNEHHDEPTLDPSAYVENFTKGAYASLPVSLLVIALSLGWTDSVSSFFVEATLLAMAVWALFFHEIHAFAHMGSALPPEVFTARVSDINRMTTKAEKKLALRRLFETVPIPAAIRLLQRVGLLLEPGRHNLHHLEFENNFSSVNGWSDPLLNPILGPIARRYKARQTMSPGAQATEVR
jgi:hypothetical protein